MSGLACFNASTGRFITSVEELNSSIEGVEENSSMLGDETSTLDAGTGGATFKSAGGRAGSATLTAGSVATWLPVSSSEEENSSLDGDEENSSMPGDETAGLDAGISGATSTTAGGRAGLEVLRVGSTESGLPVSSSEEVNSPIDGDEGKSSMPGDKTEELDTGTGGASNFTKLYRLSAYCLSRYSDLKRYNVDVTGCSTTLLLMTEQNGWHCLTKSSITSLTVAGPLAKANSGNLATTARFENGTTILADPKKVHTGGQKKPLLTHKKDINNHYRVFASQG